MYIGLLGVLPYKIGADASLFIGEASRLALRLEVAYKYWFTPSLSLTPDLEANFYSDDDLERNIGSGLSDLDLGLRLRYQILVVYRRMQVLPGKGISARPLILSKAGVMIRPIYA